MTRELLLEPHLLVGCVTRGGTRVEDRQDEEQPREQRYVKFVRSGSVITPGGTPSPGSFTRAIPACLILKRPSCRLHHQGGMHHRD